MLELITLLSKIYQNKHRKPSNAFDLNLAINDLLAMANATEFNGEGADYIYEILYWFNIQDAASSQLHEEEYGQAGNWESYYNKDLYRTILPLCRLAWLSEGNGIPEEHAFKLAVIFKSEQAVLDYLTGFKTRNNYQYLVHDACLFELPSPTECNYKQWLAIANAKGNMLNPRFRELLPHANPIEKMLSSELNSEKPPNNPALRKARERELNEISKAYKTLTHRPQRNPSQEQKNARRQEEIELKQKQSQLRIELAQLCQDTPLQSLSITALQALYEAYKQQNKDSGHQVLVQYGITDKSIALFESLNAQNNDQLIPAIHLNGADIGYPAFYLTKLDTQNKQGAALAACLGKLTTCCQYLGAIGQACVVHGIESENGGFYILWKGDANNPTLDDIVIAQAWVWRTDSDQGHLCIDSIETKQEFFNFYPDVISDMYRYLGHQLTINTQFNISLVNTGSQGGKTTNVGLNNYPAPLMHPMDFHGYRDSKAQLILANQQLPYVFYNQNNSETLNKKIQEATDAFFNTLLDTDKPLKEIPGIQTAIAFFLCSQNNALKQRLLQLVGAPRADELILLIHLNERYIQELTDLNINFEYFDNGVSINVVTIKGRSALHYAVILNDTSLADRLLKRGINTDIQDRYGNTALIFALEWNLSKHKREGAQELAHLLIDNMSTASLDIKDDDENTALIIAVKNNDLAMVIKLVERGVDLDTFDADMKTAIFWAADMGLEDIFGYLLTQKPKVNISALESGDTLMMAAVRGKNQAIIQTLFQAHPELVDLKYENKQGFSLLHYLCANDAALKLILGSVSSETLTQSSGKVPLWPFYLLKVNPDLFIETLKQLPIEDQLRYLRCQTTSPVESVIHKLSYMDNTSPSFRKSKLGKFWLLLALGNFNAEQINDLFLTEEFSHPIMYISTDWPDELNLAIIDLLPFSTWQNLLFNTRKRKESFFVDIWCYLRNERGLNLLKNVLERIPEEERYSYIIRENALRCAIHDADFFKMIFLMIPSGRRNEALTVIEPDLRGLRNSDHLEIRTLIKKLTEENTISDPFVLESKQTLPLIPLTKTLAQYYKYGQPGRPDEMRQHKNIARTTSAFYKKPCFFWQQNISARTRVWRISVEDRGLQGDALKSKILANFKTAIEACTSLAELSALKQAIKYGSRDYLVIKTSQDGFTRLFGKTDSQKAFKAMLRDKAALLNATPSNHSPNNPS